MKYTVVFAILAVLLISCGNDTSPISTDNPSNLQLNLIVYDDGSGIVALNASADNATEYHFYMNEDPNSDPVINTNGSYEHTYKTLGSYNIEVRAYGASGRYVRLNKKIVVPTADPTSTGDGYTSPLTYEGMELVWNDEFNGTSLNTDFWSYDIGTGCPNLCGWGNNELEYYRAENCSVGNGVLTLQAKRQDFENSEFTSGKVVTRNKQSFTFGRIDIRATLPVGQGVWPALWMLGVNQETVGWPMCGEIDIMEMIGGNGRENQVFGNAFWDDNGVRDESKGKKLDVGIFADEYHVFSILWTPEKITWLVDDQEFHNLDITIPSRSELQKPFYMIFNVAVGGNWPGSPDETTVFPTQMNIDYVRAFRPL